MFDWLFGKHTKSFEKKTQESFSAVKKDMDMVGKWVKHLDTQDKRVFDVVQEIKQDLSTIREEIESLREGVGLAVEGEKNKQVFKKLPVLNKQAADEAVQEAVETGVQASNNSNILKSLSANERLVLFTLLQSDMKLSYEDLALLLGKEKVTIRGQINAIKQKSEGLIEEYIEKNGKKRVYIPEEMREKLRKYVKVRVKKEKKTAKYEDIEQKSEDQEASTEK